MVILIHLIVATYSSFWSRLNTTCVLAMAGTALLIRLNTRCCLGLKQQCYLWGIAYSVDLISSFLPSGRVRNWMTMYMAHLRTFLVVLHFALPLFIFFTEIG